MLETVFLYWHSQDIVYDLEHSCREPEGVVKCCVRNFSNLVYCKVILRCGHRGFGLRSSTPSTSTSTCYTCNDTLSATCAIVDLEGGLGRREWRLSDEWRKHLRLWMLCGPRPTRKLEYGLCWEGRCMTWPDPAGWLYQHGELFFIFQGDFKDFLYVCVLQN